MEVKIYDIFYHSSLVGKIMDFDKGLVNAIRDMNTEIHVNEIDVAEIENVIPKFSGRNEILPDIITHTCECPKCNWKGTLLDCKFNVDDEGGFGCPECSAIVKIIGNLGRFS